MFWRTCWEGIFAWWWILHYCPFECRWVSKICDLGRLTWWIALSKCYESYHPARIFSSTCGTSTSMWFSSFVNTPKSIQLKYCYRNLVGFWNWQVRKRKILPWLSRLSRNGRSRWRGERIIRLSSWVRLVSWCSLGTFCYCGSRRPCLRWATYPQSYQRASTWKSSAVT